MLVSHIRSPDFAWTSSGSRHVPFDISIAGLSASTFPKSNPELRRIHWSLAFMQSWPHIGEKVVNMADNYAEDLVLGNAAVHEHVESHQNPWQVWRSEHKNPQKAQSCVGISS
jgi:hypothetical protein